MAFGAMMAYLFFYHKRRLTSLLNNKTTIVLSIFTICLWLLNPSMGFVKDVIYIVLFGIMVLAMSIGNAYWLLENKMVNYLGKISYGLYVSHWIIIYFMHQLFAQSLHYNLLLYFSSILITIIISSLSYELIEQPILKFKKRYAIIKT